MTGGPRQARQRARKGLGALRDLTIAPKTRQRYEAAVRTFFGWCELSQVDPGITNVKLIDTVEEFIEACWEEGESRAVACDSLSGLQFFVPGLKGRLTGAWRLCKAWQRHELPSRATPLTQGMARAVAMRRSSRGHWRMAAAYLIAFEVFLRTGELLGLRAQDIVLDQSGGHTAVLHLGYTKSGKRRGEPESVVLRDDMAVLALAMAVEELQPGDHLVEVTPAVFRARFADDVKSLGLSAEDYKPYSFRRGGATHRFRCGDSMSSIAERGRWAHLATCRIYINDAVGELTRITMPKSIERRISRLVSELEELLAA